MNDMTHRPSIEAPQLRTLLLTDLCDSTTLVERIGDVDAATLFRDHDRLVLDLQQRWRGRLIDRSDGMLLLFERPIDGLGFALDYMRGLREMGSARKLELKARAGLHVGEVLTWRNSDEAVQVGAKPLEVEGLAKPMAARLMAMARPGQILLSAVAEPLAHRAARELGERGQHLLWKSHGRWRFKGVPDSQQIYEVGEPGIAPLRMPPHTPKAWRDIPLWRRPAALAAEAAVIAGIGVGVWFATRPAPAIAFNQRDWVVVADLRNLTGQTVLDDSLEQAFRISLEQSRYVNVLSDLKARDTLARMQLKPDTVLDRAIASEIALRDGARAVILPTIAEVGGRVRVSAEVIDPHTQATVYTELADGTGLASTLTSIDSITASLRGQLGEAVESINKDSVPLPQASTQSLDALRAYALGQAAYGKGEFDQAMQFYDRAVALDPNFALAWLGLVRIHYSRVDTASAIVPLRKAQAAREHLAAREAMYLDAWSARFDNPSTTTSKWLELARLYPDYGAAQSNASMWLAIDNRFKDSLAFAQAAITPQNVDVGIDYDSMGRAQLVMGRYREANRSFDLAVANGYSGGARRKLAVEAAQGNLKTAAELEKKLPADDRHAYIERISLAVDRSDIKLARAHARRALALAGTTGFDARAFRMHVAVTDWLAGERVKALENAQLASQQAISALAKFPDADAEEDAGLAIAGALLALRLGDNALADKVLTSITRDKQLLKLSSVAEMTAVLKAEQIRMAGHPQGAVELLKPLLTGNERYQTRVALFNAYSDLQQVGEAKQQAAWLRANRALAYMDLTCGQCIQALNVSDSHANPLRESALAKRTGKLPGG